MTDSTEHKPIRLHSIGDNDGAMKKRKRIGRGIGSGTGKTGGRGVKGQTSRSGVAINGFEGGQMPLHMRMPKRGFTKPNRARYAELSLVRLAQHIEAGKLGSEKAFDEDALVALGIVRRKRDGVRLIGNATLPTLKGVTFTVTGASSGALSAIETAGGKVVLTNAEAGQDA
jgi:large subunit ribosomal protein L15